PGRLAAGAEGGFRGGIACSRQQCRTPVGGSQRPDSYAGSRGHQASPASAGNHGRFSPMQGAAAAAWTTPMLRQALGDIYFASFWGSFRRVDSGLGLLWTRQSLVPGVTPLRRENLGLLTRRYPLRSPRSPAAPGAAALLARRGLRGCGVFHG